MKKRPLPLREIIHRPDMVIIQAVELSRWLLDERILSNTLEITDKIVDI